MRCPAPDCDKVVPGIYCAKHTPQHDRGRIVFYVRPVLLHRDGTAEVIKWEDNRKANRFGLYRREANGWSTHIADFRHSWIAIQARMALDRSMETD